MSEPTAEAGAVHVPEEKAAVPEAKVQDAVPSDAGPEVAVKVEGEGAEGATSEVAEKVEGETNAANGDNTDETKPAGDMLKTKNRIDHKNRSSNRKFDPSVLPETDDPEKIRNQVEFYFGDSNLPHDKHMWNLTGGQENKPVSLKDICSFGRMRRFKPYSAVVAALQDSKVLIVSGPEGEEVIKRKKAYVPASNAAQARMAASVYVKGFGDEEPSTQFDIEAFFARYGPVNAIRLRRTPENLFKGSVFVEFQSEELAKKFLELDPKPTWKGHELKTMSKKDYVDEKTKMIQSGEIEASNNRQARFFEGRETGGRGGRGRGRDSRRSDSDDWKKRREEDQKNGFRDRRQQRGGYRPRRGRGGRGGHHSRNDRNVGKEGSTEGRADDATSAAPATDQTTNGKRAREDDGETQPPAKKVDAKNGELSAEAS